MDINSLTKAIQSRIGAEQDGAWGPDTASRVFKALFGYPPDRPSAVVGPEVSAPIVTDENSRVDARSEKVIARLAPEVQLYARTLVKLASGQGMEIVVTSGLRSYDEQTELYAKGRTKPGAIVTNAKAGQSNHNFGIAFDVTLFWDGKPVWESPAYKAIGALGKSIGLTWGGDWVTIDDEPHFELHPAWAANLSEAEMLARLRSKKDAGQPLFSA